MAPELVVLALAGAAAGFSVWESVRAGRDLAFMHTVLNGLLPSGAVSTRQDLVIIKNALAERLSFDRSLRDAPRPLLRHEASHIWTSRYGFCGENARCAIVLLTLGGQRAHRLYVEGPRFSHVAVEVWWQGRWTLFDGHRDPKTLLADDSVGSIDSDDPTRFPTAYEENPWQHAYRIKLLKRLRLPSWWAQRRVPRIIALLAEVPAAIRSLAWGGLSLTLAVGGALWLRS